MNYKYHAACANMNIIRSNFWVIFFVIFLGTTTSGYLPSFQSPDEYDHIKRAYLLSKGKVALFTPEGSSSGGMIDTGLLKYMNFYLSLPFKPHVKLSAEEEHEANNIKWTNAKEFSKAPGTGYYFPLIYAPQAIGLALGRYFEFGVGDSYRLARFMALSFIAVTLTFAFSIYPANPLVILLLIIPMSIFQISSASLDGVSTALAILVISIFMRISVDRREAQPWLVYLLIFTIFVTASSRIHLLPFLLMALAACALTKRRRYIFLVAFTTLAVFLWTLFAIKFTVDTRVTTGLPTYKIVNYYLNNPGAFFGVLGSTLYLDNRLSFYKNSFYGILGWLDTPLTENLYNILLVLSISIGLLSVSVKNIVSNWQPRLTLLVCATISVLIVFFALLVTWNPHPAIRIDGVQGRYFLIPFIMFSYAISGESKLSTGFSRKVALTLVFLAALVSVSQTPSILLERYFISPRQTVHVSPFKEDLFLPVQARAIGVNDLVTIDGSNLHRSIGIDPFFLFSLPDPVTTKSTRYMSFRLDCNGIYEPVHLQLFWHANGDEFSESESLRFIAFPGLSTVDLLPHSRWTNSGTVSDIRIDIDSRGACPIVSIDSLELGKFNF